MKVEFLNQEKVRAVPDDGILYVDVEEVENDSSTGVSDGRLDRFLKFVSLAFVVERVVNSVKKNGN